MQTSTCRTVLLAAVALLGLAIPASAQLPSVFTCPKGAFEDEAQWTRRCREQEDRQYKEDADRRSRAMMQQLGETERQRAILEKQPPLPASRNRLIGRWETATKRPAASADPFAQLAALTAGCGVLIGDAIVEFQEARWAIYDEDGRNDMGAAEYRGGANGSVFVLPAKGGIFNLLPFEFETPDRIHLVGVVCTLVRTNATVPAAAPAAPGGSPRSRATAAKPAAPAAAPPRPAAAPSAGLGMIRDRIGYQCPDGQKLAVERCFSEADEAECSVVRVDLPPRNGLEVTFIEKRGVLKKKVASCTQRGLVLDSNKLLALAP